MTEKIFFINLGLRIKELRVLKKMTQNDLATECNFENASMSRIEAGKTNMTLRSLLKICKALEINMMELFSNEK